MQQITLRAIRKNSPKPQSPRHSGLRDEGVTRLQEILQDAIREKDSTARSLTSAITELDEADAKHLTLQNQIAIKDVKIKSLQAEIDIMAKQLQRDICTGARDTALAELKSQLRIKGAKKVAWVWDSWNPTKISTKRNVHDLESLGIGRLRESQISLTSWVWNSWNPRKLKDQEGICA
jgi:hypothetical protein